jgi:hypothetical protein
MYSPINYTYYIYYIYYIHYIHYIYYIYYIYYSLYILFFRHNQSEGGGRRVAARGHRSQVHRQAERQGGDSVVGKYGGWCCAEGGEHRGQRAVFPGPGSAVFALLGADRYDAR